MNGYVDLQVNGYAGIDFNTESLTGEQLHQACQALERDGVQGILATLITDDISALQRKIARIVQIREQDPLVHDMIWGLHIEGPFISPEPGYIGAHPACFARPADCGLMDQLLQAGDGLIRLVTLAPEMDPSCEVTQFLSRQNILVAAGHSNASRDQLSAAIDAGLNLFTHLGNGCPQSLPRHDNIIQRALSLSDRLWISVIADGAHLPFFVLENFLRQTGAEKIIVVTDAISAAGCGPGRFQLGDRWVNVGEDGVPRADDHSHLVGSGTTMPQMARNLTSQLRLPLETVEALTKWNPRELLHGIPA